MWKASLSPVTCFTLFHLRFFYIPPEELFAKSLNFYTLGIHRPANIRYDGWNPLGIEMDPHNTLTQQDLHMSSMKITVFVEGSLSDV